MREEIMENISINILQEYLKNHYEGKTNKQNLFMKLVEEVGEVAEILNIMEGRKISNKKDLKKDLAIELADIIHYTVSIAALNEINLTESIINKDEKAAKKYNHDINLKEFIKIKNEKK